ncbi:MAG: phosphoenolpyruvate kinase [Gemmatimonadetes bacterium]|nr:phosphoenolpyruvate kinase [Gemmatimonadota bacterium]
MNPTLPHDVVQPLVARLQAANRSFVEARPGDSGRRQPVHTVYGGAHLFRADSAPKLGALALRALEQYAPDFVTLARALELPGAGALPRTSTNIAQLSARLASEGEALRKSEPEAWLAHTVYTRVVDKLRREAVEDFRIDFEDGYGNRPDEEEDGHAVAAAGELARGLAAGALPPFIGVRIKPLSEEVRERAIRTLDLFLTALVRETGGRLPPGFVVTLPKITHVEQVSFLAEALALLEPRLALGEGALRFEIMVETPQSIIGMDGDVPLPRLVEAGKGRITAAHFGTYDFTAACNITAMHQHMRHPVCDFARQVMQVALAGTGIWLSDGSTTVMPVPQHRAEPGGPPLTPEQEAENRAAVHRAWKLHYDDIQHSLRLGFYQGWDLHPAQLPTRYAALYSFFLRGLDAAAQRLRNFVGKAAQATLVGDIFDDAATGQGLLNYFLRAINCGAVTEDETASLTGLTLEELRSRSFVRILRARRGQ